MLKCVHTSESYKQELEDLGHLAGGGLSGHASEVSSFLALSAGGYISCWTMLFVTSRKIATPAASFAVTSYTVLDVV